MRFSWCIQAAFILYLSYIIYAFIVYDVFIRSQYVCLVCSLCCHCGTVTYLCCVHYVPVVLSRCIPYVSVMYALCSYVVCGVDSFCIDGAFSMLSTFVHGIDNISALCLQFVFMRQSWCSNYICIGNWSYVHIKYPCCAHGAFLVVSLCLYNVHSVWTRWLRLVSTMRPWWSTSHSWCSLGAAWCMHRV